ncbi:uncharacterized protein LOC144870138 [Branchiostoma floridae x Branchiostoma japonicum]
MSSGCCCVAVILAVCVGLAIVVVAVFGGLRIVERPKPASPTGTPRGKTTAMPTTTPMPTTTLKPLTKPSGPHGLPQPLVVGLSVGSGVIVLLLCCCCLSCRCCYCYCEGSEFSIHLHQAPSSFGNYQRI